MFYWHKTCTIKLENLEATLKKTFQTHRLSECTPCWLQINDMNIVLLTATFTIHITSKFKQIQNQSRQEKSYHTPKHVKKQISKSFTIEKQQ